MMKLIRTVTGIIGATLLLSGCMPESTEQQRDLILDEKLGQLTLYTSDWDVTGPSIRQNYLEDIRSGNCGNIFNAHTVAYNRKLQQTAVEESRLGIPLLFGYDVVHGHRTIFPVPLAEACSWNLELMKKSTELAAKEAAASGLNWTFAPIADISRDPRWGRVSEGNGEDTYLPPYQSGVEAGTVTVMASFNDLFGVPATASKYLMTDILREEWGFEGFVVTDYSYLDESREKEVVFSDELMNHALQSALESVVMLKNEALRGSNILPLESPRKIAVIGPLAYNQLDVMGSWHAAGDQTRVVTLLEGLKRKFRNAEVNYQQGCGFYDSDPSEFRRAIQLAKQSDVAILYAWHLGTRSGDALAEILSGNYNPLYPFGYGLSYTTFKYGEIELSESHMERKDTLKISISVENTGNFSGEEIVQLYVQDMVGSLTRPVKELKAFKKVLLPEGEQRTLHFTLTAEDLAFVGGDLEYIVEPGDFKVFIGPNSEDLKQAGFMLND